MPSFTAGDIEDCLTRKLRSPAQQRTKHKLFEVYDDAGHLVATTAMSRGWRRSQSLSPSMVSTIRQELGMQGHSMEFNSLIRCSFQRPDYLRLMGAIVL